MENKWLLALRSVWGNQKIEKVDKTFIRHAYISDEVIKQEGLSVLHSQLL